MNRTGSFFVVGLLVGAAVGAGIVLLASGDGEAERLRQANVTLRADLEDARGEMADVKSDLEQARGRLARSEETEKDAAAQLAAAREKIRVLEESPRPDGAADGPAATSPEAGDPEEGHGLTDDQLRSRLMALGGKLQGGIMSGNMEGIRNEMREILDAGGPGTLQRVLDLYRTIEGIGPKSVLAHALAQSGDPEAVAALKEIVLDPDASLFDRRTASHGLAFVDDPALEPFYRQVANDTRIERGARANIAYGLARRSDEGIELYGKTVDEAFAAKDSLATAYLSGFMLLGKRAVPAVEKRLRTIHEPQARLLMIQHLAENGDASTIPTLRAVADEPGVSKDVRDAAEKAAAKLAQAD